MLELLIVAAAIVLAALWLRRHLAAGRRRRSSVVAKPFPEDWRRILERNVPVSRRLDTDQRRRLEKLIQGFVDGIPFEGCGGLEVTDEMRVTIAAQACLLVLGSRRRASFPLLRAILLYPTTYSAKAERGLGWGAVEEGDQHRLGESWQSGYVVLAWDAVLHGAAEPADGHNVVLHELAHQLDQEDGTADGVPVVEGLRYGTWARVLERDFHQLLEGTGPHPAVLDSYATTNPAEFFAVATETFFEKPHDLRRHYGELYQLLRDFYGLDPAEWQRGA